MTQRRVITTAEELGELKSTAIVVHNLGDMNQQVIYERMYIMWHCSVGYDAWDDDSTVKLPVTVLFDPAELVS